MTKVWLQMDVREVGLFAGLVVLAWVVGWLLKRVLGARLRRLREAGAAVGRFEVLQALVPIVRWGLFLGALAVGLHLMRLPKPVAAWLNSVLQSAFTLMCALVASGAVRVAFKQWAKRPADPAEARTRATLAPVLAKSCHLVLVAIALLLILQNSGYNVAGLLAGLGIGGLAVALAAKETLANLFGSIAVLMDRTFQVGDNIRQGDTIGTVVRIGLRSTRVRTAEGYIVSIPNQIITNAPVTNMGSSPLPVPQLKDPKTPEPKPR